MAQLISKSALVAEIKKLSQKAIELYGYSQFNTAYNNVLSILDTLEVKEVDLEEEIKRFTMSKELYEADSVIKAVAKHFFELGLKAQKMTQEDKEFKSKGMARASPKS